MTPLLLLALLQEDLVIFCIHTLCSTSGFFPCISSRVFSLDPRWNWAGRHYSCQHSVFLPLLKSFSVNQTLLLFFLFFSFTCGRGSDPPPPMFTSIHLISNSCLLFTGQEKNYKAVVVEFLDFPLILVVVCVGGGGGYTSSLTVVDGAWVFCFVGWRWKQNAVNAEHSERNSSIYSIQWTIPDTVNYGY